MDDLIKALQLLRKYDNPEWPLICEHDELRVRIDPRGVSREDIIALDELGFYPEEENDCFISYRFGSA